MGNVKIWRILTQPLQNADFQSVFAHSASAVTPSKRSSVKTNRKSTTHFPVRLRWTSYVAPKPPKRGSKTQNGCFPCKIAFHLKKVCYKVSLCENLHRRSCKAFTSLSIRAEMIGRDVPLNIDFALSGPLLGMAPCWLALSQNLNLRLLIMFINWTNCGVWMHYTIAD